MQGISPLVDRAAVVEWHTSSVPIDTVARSDRKGSEGGTTILRAIARITINAYHFMVESR